LVERQVSFQLQCAGSRHVDQDQTVTLDATPGTSGVPAGGSLTATAATIGPIPASWPDDTTGPSNCGTTPPTPIQDNGNTTVKFTAPSNAADGAVYNFSVTWGGADVTVLPSGGSDSNAVTGSTQVFFRVTVDAQAPDTTIDSGPSGTVNSNSATFTFSSNEVNSTFETNLDGAGWVPTDNNGTSTSNTYNGLSDAEHTFQVRATDAVGNTDASPASRTWTVQSDSTAPVIDYTLDPASPDGDNDWYKSSVTLTWNVTDPESAVTKTGCNDQNITTDQVATTYSCSATSAGGSAGPVNVSIKRDGSAPNAPTATTNPASPVANSGGFFKDTVKVSYGGSTDVGPSGVASYTADQTFNTTGTHNYSGKATDNAGNQSTATTGQVKVDANAPTVGISGCPSSPVLLNSTQSINVTASDQANGSGLVSDPSGSVSLDTSSVGSKSKTITVDDKVGHSASATCNYSVNYNFIGFSSPVDNPGVLNVAKAGSAIPLKWQLLDANGPVTNLSSVNLSVATLACAGLGTTDDLKVYASGSSGLQNLGGGYYQFNWKSQSSYSNSCKTLTLDLGEGKDANGDPITHKALFQFKK